jgi:hypothetical protein
MVGQPHMGRGPRDPDQNIPWSRPGPLRRREFLGRISMAIRFCLATLNTQKLKSSHGKLKPKSKFSSWLKKSDSKMVGQLFHNPNRCRFHVPHALITPKQIQTSVTPLHHDPDLCIIYSESATTTGIPVDFTDILLQVCFTEKRE